MDIAHIGHVAVSGVRATTVFSTEIPAGMIGGYITLDFDDSWDGFTRHVTIEGSGVKTTLGVSDKVSVDKALIEYPNVRVKVGITGVSEDGSQVIPTMWAELGTTRPGAPTDLGGGTSEGDQESPIWAQIIGMIGDLNALETEDKRNLVAAVNEVMRNGGGGAGGYYTPVVTQPTDNTLLISFVPSVATMPAVEPVTINLPGSGSGQNPTGGGLTAAQIEALDGMFRVCAYDDSKDVSGAYAVFRAAFGIPDDRTLTSISATYGGGDVAVGTSVTALTGIAVTAHYSDGTSEPVTGYTLSGTIAKGSNTVTVTYEGLTTTFIVTGIVDEPEAVTYTVTNALTNVLSNNAATSATEGTKYTATLTAVSGYIMGDVTVTMGGVDITETAFSGVVVTIPSVTGNIVITAVGVEDNGAITLDSIAYENKTYRDIFVTGNGFANGDMEGDALPGNGKINAGNPELTSEVYCTPYHSLKCCGTTSQQLANVGADGNGPGGGALSGNYIAFKGRCDRYESGWLGLNDADTNITSVTDGFVTRSKMNFAGTVRFCGSGSLDGKPGNLDGYLDAIVYIGLDRFTNKPSKALLDELYETYILILQNGGSYMPGEV